MNKYLQFVRGFGSEIAIRIRAGKYKEAIEYSSNELLHKSGILLGSDQSEGQNIFDKNWDVLIILDACRVDLLESVIDNYEWLPETVQTIKSTGWNSPVWMKRTFCDEYLDEIQKTKLVTANPHTERVFDGKSEVNLESFSDVSLVYQHSWDSNIGTVQPDIMTDTAIDIGREEEFDRMIVHYMQPHFPSIPNPELESGIEYVPGEFPWKNNIWERLKRGQIDRERVWQAYKENLKYVLEYVNILRTNISANKFILSADHGNAMGEKGYYGHSYNPTKSVRVVPWVEINAKDNRTHEVNISKKPQKEDIDEKLEALGYKL